MKWSFCDNATGMFASRIVECSKKLAELNTPDGQIAVEGEFDSLSQRIDMAALAKAERGDFSQPADFVVDYQPPQPDANHEWRAENPTAVTRAKQRWRWRKKRAVVLRDNKDAAARAIIAQAELAQARIVREFLLTLPNLPAQMRTRLEAIETTIVAARADLI